MRKFKDFLSGKTSSGAVIQTFIVKVFILVINLGTGIISARALGASGRGELAAMGLWPQFLVFILAMGIPRSLQYNLKKFPEEESEFFTISTLLSLGIGILSILLGIVFIPKWLAEYSEQVIFSARIIMLIAPVPLLAVVFKSIFESRGEFTISNRMYYFHPLMTFTLIFTFVFLNLKSPFIFALAYALPQTPLVIWMFIKLRKHYGLVFKNPLSVSQRLLSFGFRSHGLGLVGYLSTQIGQVLAVGLLASSGMGMYTVALNLTRPLNTIEQSIITVLFPKTASQALPTVISLVGRASRVSIFLTTICVIPLGILAPFLLPILYGNEFIEASTTFRILLLQVLLEGATWMLSQSFMASGRPGVITALQISGLFVTVPLMIWLVPLFGMNGVAFSLLLSTILRFVIVLSCYPLILKIKPPKLLISINEIRDIKKSFCF